MRDIWTFFKAPPCTYYTRDDHHSVGFKARGLLCASAEIALREHSQEAIMPGPAVEESLHPSHHIDEKPHPKSYDSSDECSLDHWLEVYWLVEEEYKFAKATESEA